VHDRDWKPQPQAPSTVTPAAGTIAAPSSQQTPRPPTRQIITIPPREKTLPRPDVSEEPRYGPISPAEHRIQTLANKRVIVGVQAKITVTGAPAVEGLGRGTAFSAVDERIAAGLGGPIRTAGLPDVTLPNWVRAREGSQKPAGVVVEPDPGAHELEVLAWNTGQPQLQSNVSHAEAQVIAWFRGLDPAWKLRVKRVDVAVFGKEICEACASDVAALKRAYPHIEFNWVRADTGAQLGNFP
jgi:hypothetical protein